MNKKQKLKNIEDLYYENYTDLNKNNIKHQKILNEFEILRDQYFNEAMKNIQMENL